MNQRENFDSIDYKRRAASSPGVDICGLDGVEEQLGHTHPLHVDEVRLKQSLGGFEPLASDLDHPAVRELRTHTKFLPSEM